MKLADLPTELLSQILEEVGVGSLGPLTLLDKTFYRLTRSLLMKELPKYTINLAIRQNANQLCPLFKFEKFDLQTNKITFVANNKKFKNEARFSTNVLKHQPLARYLKVRHGQSLVENIPLSRPLNIPVNKVGTFITRGHKNEVALVYSVKDEPTQFGMDEEEYYKSEGFMSILRLELDLKMLSYNSVADTKVSSFPPQSLVQWIGFKLLTNCHEERFYSAIPKYPILPPSLLKKLAFKIRPHPYYHP